MCVIEDIDAILERIKNYPDPEEKRRILDEIIPCKICIQKNRGRKSPCDCRCMQEFQTELLNTMEHVRLHGYTIKS
jgi:hypothetical protein